MSVIKVLDKSVSELIAAGEVIEKPASVIKELVENSIDAGATRITVEIKNGGTTFMRIVDDGCGMSAEDVPKAFLRHATSKVREKIDLENIHTLGFRGEALASVSAVSRVTVLTKRKEEEFGSQYEIAGGEDTEVEECGCPDGTTLIIRDLFFNVPARRKFMKKDVAEGNAISQIIQKIAISHPEIAFKFIRDNKLDFHSDGTGELIEAIHAVYGKDFARDLIPVSHEQDGISVNGYVIKPLYAKNNRSFQNFFVNGRYVKSKSCSVALESAYENLLMTGKFPACVLMLDMPADSLDVNIHPSKAEVRFSEEKQVIDAVYFAVKNAFLKNGLIYEFQTRKADWYGGTPQPEYTQKPLVSEPSAPVSRPQIPEQKPRFQTLNQQDMPFQINLPQPSGYMEQEPEEPKPSRYVREPLPKTLTVPDSYLDIHPEPEELEEEIQISAPEEVPEPETVQEYQDPVFPPEQEMFQNIQVIGELFGNYITAQAGDNMIIIDKHAAHERIIFERLRKENCQQYRQALLSPCKVLLTLEEFSVMEENPELLKRLGFTFDFSEKPCLTATAAPLFFSEMNLEEIIQEIAHNLYLGKVNPQSRALEDTLHELACKSAIRAHDKNTLQEMQSLAEQVCRDENIRHCPHGRPVMFVLSKYQLEKQFKRII